MDFPEYMSNAIASSATQALATGGAAMLAYNRNRKNRNAKKNMPTKSALYRQVLRNRGELHNKQYTGVVTVPAGTATVRLLNDISQGDDSDDRSGRHITNYGYAMRGKTTDRALDVYIVHSKSGIAPLLADFQPIIGGFLKDESNKDLRIIKDLRHYASITTYFRGGARWKRGTNSAYSGPIGNNIVKNGYYLVLLNNSLAAVQCDYSLNWYYRDH